MDNYLTTRNRVLDYSLLIILPLVSIIVILTDSHFGTDKFSLISFYLTLAILFSFFTVFLINDFYYKIFFSLFILTVYFFSIVSEYQSADWLQYTIILIVYMIFFLYTFSIERVFSYKIKFKSFESFTLVLYFLSLIVSVFLINIKDFLFLEGLLKIFVIIMSVFIMGYYLPVILLEREDLLLSIIRLVFYTGFFSVIIGILTLFSIITFNPLFSNTTISFFMHTNNTPFLYTFSIPCGLYLFFSKKQYLILIEKYFILPIIVLMIFSVLFTYSRAGILAMVVEIMVFAFFYSKVVFAFIFPVFAASGMVVFNSFLAVKGVASAFSRTALIAAAITMLRSSKTGLLFGFGAYSARKDYKIVMESLGIFEKNIDFPHNFILFYIMQFGLVSFILLSIFILFHLGKSFSNISKFKDSYYSKLLAMVLSITMGIFVQSLLEDMILFPQYFVFHLTLVFVGILVLINSKFKYLNY